MSIEHLHHCARGLVADLVRDEATGERGGEGGHRLRPPSADHGGSGTSSVIRGSVVGVQHSKTGRLRVPYVPIMGPE